MNVLLILLEVQRFKIESLVQTQVIEFISTFLRAKHHLCLDFAFCYLCQSLI